MFNILNILPMLIKLEEKDKRLLIALFILLIVIFVLIAYIVNGIKVLMRKYAKGIDGYMHTLCKEGEIKDPKEFKIQVYKRETKTLYLSTRWAFRVGLVVTVVLLCYGFIARPSGDNIFAFYGKALNDLTITLYWPTGDFFGISNFPIDWPVVGKWPTPEFTLPSIITYLTVIAYIYVAVVLIISTMKFIARLNRARVKSEEVFSKSLDNLEIDGDEVDESK